MAGVSGILIAAGESSRMGRPKALLEWEGVPLIQYQIRSLAQGGVEEVIVVLGHQAAELAPYVRGAEHLKAVVNPRYGEGKTTSIRRGLQEVSPKARGILLLAVDQPRPAAVIQELLASHQERSALITQPAYQGRRGHPLIFDASLMSELLAVREEARGVHEVVQRHRGQVNLVAVDTPAVLLDINTEEEYQRARQGLPGAARALRGPSEHGS
ncbi:MAG: nucleotidyltransferase family protein [Chloroflexi bacterium]|nr:nucleotidyltransferase family protein [Chloroflexota bacterium]